jgi:hypothetical protein
MFDFMGRSRRGKVLVALPPGDEKFELLRAYTLYGVDKVGTEIPRWIPAFGTVTQ